MNRLATRLVKARAFTLILLFAVSLTAACSNPEQEKAEHVARGEQLLKDKKYQEAALEFRSALQIDDRLAPAYWGLARAFEGQDRLLDAFDMLKRTVEIDQNHIEARVKLGNYHLLSRPPDVNEAERLAREVLQKNPNETEGHVLLASVYFQRGERDQAFNEIKRAIEIDPQRVETRLSLARFYMQTNDVAKAEEALKQAIQINNNSSLAHAEYGKFLVQTERSAEAEAEFKRAVELDPTDRDARRVLASFYFVNKRMPEAEQAYRALAELDKDRPEGMAVLADFYALTGRYDEAARIYAEAIKKSPDYTRGRYRLGEILLQRGDVKGALEQAGEILKSNERDTQARLLRARVNLQNGDFKPAIDDLSEVLKVDTNSRPALYFMAEANLRAGQVEQARIYAGDLERYHPNYLPAKLMNVQVALAAGDAKNALRLSNDLLSQLDRAAPDSQTSPQLLDELRAKTITSRGLANLRLNNTPAARSDMEAAMQRAPNQTSSYVNLAQVARAEGKRDEAINFYNRALQIDKTSFDALNGLIDTYAAAREFDKAHAAVDQALAAKQTASLLYLKGQVFGLQSGASQAGNDQVQAERDAAQAEATLNRAIETDADYLPARFSLAAIYVNLKQHDRAIAEYRKIIERKPDNASAFTLIGMVEDSRGNREAAAENYHRALDIDPNATVAANNLAWLYAEHEVGNPDEAMRLAQTVVQRNPAEPGFADTLGWVYFRKGLYPAAVEQLQRAVTKSVEAGRDSAAYRYHLGRALAANGDKARARRELQQSLALGEKQQQFPEADSVRRALAEVEAGA